MRTYSFLIQYESDFRIAREAGLIPKHVHDFTQFTDCIMTFRSIDDTMVSDRYHFGELRLSRLNFWAKIFLRRWEYHKVHWAYGAYFAQFYGPLLFIFGVLSLFLSAMQVVFAATLPSSWQIFSPISRDFSAAVLIFLVAVCALLFAIYMFMGLREIIYASQDYVRKSRQIRRPKPVV